MDVLHHTVSKIRIMKNKAFYLFWNSHGRLGVLHLRSPAWVSTVCSVLSCSCTPAYAGVSKWCDCCLH